MSNKTDLQENNVILGNSAEGLLGGLSKVKNALADKNIKVNQAGVNPTFNEIRSAIESGVANLSDTTATAGDVATGKVFYDKDGVKTEGSLKLPSGNIDITKEGIFDVKEYATATIQIKDEWLVINLPEELADTASINYFQINENNILYSTTTDSTGLWLYRIKEKENIKLYEKGSYWDTFRLVNNICFIASSQNRTGSTGILRYDILSESLKKIHDKSYSWRNYYVVGDKCLIAGYNTSDFLIYSFVEDNIVKVLTGTTYLSTFKEINGKIWVSGSSNGIYLYNPADETLTKIYSESGSYYTTFTQVGDKWLVTGAHSSAKGILRYDPATETIEKVYDVGGYWLIVQDFDDFILFTSGTSSPADTGIVKYDKTSGIVTQIYNVGYSWTKIQEVADKLLICSEVQNTKGVLIFDKLTHSVNLGYALGYAWKFCVIGNDCLMGCNTTSNTGLILFNYNDLTISQIYASYYGWVEFLVLEDIVLVGGTKNSYGVLMYDSVTKTATRLAPTSNGYNLLVKVGDNAVIGSSEINCFGFGTFNSKEKTSVYNGSGRQINTFELDDKGGCYISSSYSDVKTVFYYDSIADNISLVKYKVGKI